MRVLTEAGYYPPPPPSDEPLIVTAAILGVIGVIIALMVALG